MRDAPPPVPPPPDGGPEALPPALSERLRGLSVPDPGAAYWAALPGRVTARAAGQGAPRHAARGPRDRAATRHATQRRHTAARLATASLAVVLLALSVLWIGRSDPFARAPRPAALAAIPVPSGAASGDVAPGDTVRPMLRGTVPAPSRNAAPRPEDRRRAGPIAPEAPMRPVPTQRLASADVDVDAGADVERTRRAARALADSADAEGVRLLRRAQLVALALQNATGASDVSVLAPLASGLAAGLAQWRSVPGVDPALVASADVLEPIVVGLGLLAPADSAGARQLRDAARRADLSLQLDRALIAAGRPLSAMY